MQPARPLRAVHIDVVGAELVYHEQHDEFRRSAVGGNALRRYDAGDGNGGHAECRRACRRHDDRSTQPPRPADVTDQNVTLRPNWTWRAGAAELITPKVDDPKTVPGFAKFVRLMTLKTSARNSGRIRSVMVKLRISDIST